MNRTARRFAPVLLAGGALAAVACSTASPKPTGGRVEETEPDAGMKPGAGLPDAAPDAGMPAPPSKAPAFDGGRADAVAHLFDASPSPADGGPEADGGLVCHGAGSRFATGSPAHSFGPGQDTGQNLFPAPVLGPPKGGGICQGSTDVVSLGNGGFVVLEFAGNAIVDGPGPDFIVFENPFGVDCDPSQIFAELGTVAVSEDGEHWTDFPCTATTPPYGQCSGWRIVNANAGGNDIDPTDPAVAGGDPYDLADIGVKSARYVRVTDRADLTGQAGVYDLDAVSIVHPACP
jgi:hypothetical protein